MKSHRRLARCYIILNHGLFFILINLRMFLFQKNDRSSDTAVQTAVDGRFGGGFLRRGIDSACQLENHNIGR